jgi:SRSO17 transposase
LSHPAPQTPVRVLAAVLKARWVCEPAHQPLKDELGLDQCEGRSWSGLHHHVRLTMLAFAFLQSLRLRQSTPGTQVAQGPPPQPSLPAVRRALVGLLSAARRCPWCDGPPPFLRSLIRKMAK